MKSRKRRFKQDTSQDDPSDTEKENDELRLCLTIALDEDKEVDYEILDKKYPIIDWKTEYLGTKLQFDESKRLEEINLNVVTRSNGQKRYFSTLMRVLLVFDREDLDAVYKLVMNIYQDKIPEAEMDYSQLKLPQFLRGTITFVDDERISHSYANRKEVSFEDGNTGCKDPFSFIPGPLSSQCLLLTHLLLIHQAIFLSPNPKEDSEEDDDEDHEEDPADYPADGGDDGDDEDEPSDD
ncbi:hypothetical protein Tco_0411861 [Tanacetum coccineum]